MGTTGMVETVYPSEAGFICHNHIPLSSSLFFTECDISVFFFTEVSLMEHGHEHMGSSRPV
jgi:hypothetical protein